MRLVFLALALILHFPPSRSNQEINNSTLKNSPIFNGDNNTFKQITNIQKSLPIAEIDSIKKSATSLEATSSSLIEIIDYFSERNAETAKNLGNPRLSADIEKQRIKTLEIANTNKNDLVAALLKLSEIESLYEVPSAIATLIKASSVNPSQHEATLRLIQLQLKYQFLEDAIESIQRIKKSWPQLNPQQRFRTQTYELIYLDTTEQFHLVKDRTKALLHEFQSLSGEEKKLFVEDANIALSTALRTQYLRGESTEEFSKLLLRLIEDNYFTSASERPVLTLGFGNHAIQLDSNKVILVTDFVPLKSRSANTPSISIYGSTLEPARKLAAHTSVVEGKLRTIDLSTAGLNAQRLAILNTKSLTKLNPECNDCPITNRAEIAQLIIQNKIHLDSEDDTSAYTTALEILSRIKNLAPSVGATPLFSRLEAIGLETLGKARIQMSANTAGHSFFSDNSALNSSTKKLDDIEKNIGLNLSLKLVKARILKTSADYFRSTGHIGLSWMYCESVLNTISIPLQLEPLRSSVRDYYIDCQNSRLERFLSTTGDPTEDQKRYFQKEAFEFFTFLEKNQIELTDYGKSWIELLKKKSKELWTPNEPTSSEFDPKPST